MSCENQGESRSQPFLSRNATLVSSSLPDETKPDAFFLQTIPDSIIFEMPQTYQNIHREQTEMKTKFEIEKYIFRKKKGVVASSEFVIFIVSLFFCFENSEVWLFWVINIILLDWIIWRAKCNISRPRGSSLCTE